MTPSDYATHPALFAAADAHAVVHGWDTWLPFFLRLVRECTERQALPLTRPAMRRAA